MRLLLDTHTLLWALLDTKNIPGDLTSLIADPGHEVFISAVSFWEISLKHALGKLKLNKIAPETLIHKAVESGFDLLPLDPIDAASFAALPKLKHKDPFDRMLVWQAIRGSYTLVSKDKDMRAYEKVGLRVIWDI